MNFLQNAIRKLVEDEFSTLAAKGYTFELDYELEEGDAISYNAENVDAVDMATVHCSYDGKPSGPVLLIPSNDYDIVSDWTFSIDDVDGRYAAPVAAWERIIKELEDVS